MALQGLAPPTDVLDALTVGALDRRAHEVGAWADGDATDGNGDTPGPHHFEQTRPDPAY